MPACNPRASGVAPARAASTTRIAATAASPKGFSTKTGWPASAPACVRAAGFASGAAIKTASSRGRRIRACAYAHSVPHRAGARARRSPSASIQASPRAPGLCDRGRAWRAPIGPTPITPPETLSISPRRSAVPGIEKRSAHCITSREAAASPARRNVAAGPPLRAGRSSPASGPAGLRRGWGRRARGPRRTMRKPACLRALGPARPGAAPRGPVKAPGNYRTLSAASLN